MKSLSLLARGLVFACFAPVLSVAQNVTERSVEIRTSLSFRVSASAVQKLLPSGWTVRPSTAGKKWGHSLGFTHKFNVLHVGNSSERIRCVGGRLTVCRSAAYAFEKWSRRNASHPIRSSEL
jgi:hypothetical protein